MPTPNAFISSTYLDLKEVRDAVNEYLRTQRWHTTLFELGGVLFDPTVPIDESCYESVRTCDFFILIIGGRYGAPATAESGLQAYNSITKTEYITARKNGVPTAIFVKKDVMSDYRTWSKNLSPVRNQMVYAAVDSPLIFQLIEELRAQEPQPYLYEWESARDVITHLARHFAGLVYQALQAQRERLMPDAVPINGYKLYYYRSQRGMTQKQLAKSVGVGRGLVQRLEKVARIAGRQDIDVFARTNDHTLKKIEAALDCSSRLRAGQFDDFQSAYLLYYEHRKLSRRKKGKRRRGENFPTKVIAFDFEGTLSKRLDSEDELTTWEKIWTTLGYGTDECSFHLQRYRKGEITHQEWCDITADRFRSAGCSAQQVKQIASRIELLPHVVELLQELASTGIKMYLISGSIDLLIKEVLGPHVSYFRDVRANEFIWDESGNLESIVGTQFDFEGKARYLLRVMEDEKVNPLEILYVGNSMNDAFVSAAGVRTLCINPHYTDYTNEDVWNHYLRECNDARQILSFTHLR